MSAVTAAGGFTLFLIPLKNKNDSDYNCDKNKTNDYAADVGRNPS